MDRDVEMAMICTYEQVGVGRGHLCAHGSSLDLEVMLGVKGEVAVSEDELGKLDKKLVRSGDC